MGLHVTDDKTLVYDGMAWHERRSCNRLAFLLAYYWHCEEDYDERLNNFFDILLFVWLVLKETRVTSSLANTLPPPSHDNPFTHF
jgi:hypothetical protein